MRKTMITLILFMVILVAIPTVGMRGGTEEAYISYVEYERHEIRLNYEIHTAIVIDDDGVYQNLAKELEARGLQVTTATTPEAIAQALSSIGSKAVILASSKTPGLEDILVGALARGHVVIADNRLYEALLNRLSLQACPKTALDTYHIMIKPIDRGAIHFLLVNNISSATTAEAMADYILRATYTVLKTGCHQWLATISYIGEWQPYGRIDVDHQLYYYSCDGNPSQDPYYIVATTRIVPGKYLGWSDGWKQWWSDRIQTRYDLGDPNLNLYDFEPANRQIPRTTITVTLSMPPAVSVTWKYGGEGGIEEVIPLGLTGDDFAEWTHELGSGFWSTFPSGVDWPVKVEPGLSFAANEGSHTVQYWWITGVWSRPGYRGMPTDTFQATLPIELHLIS